MRRYLGIFSVVGALLTLMVNYTSPPCSVTMVAHQRNITSAGAYLRPINIFGHIHMAKTAGTTLNGELAAHFERICGHKGYSYDAFKAINRYRKAKIESPTPKDIYANAFPQFSRQRVPTEIMEEIGYENCDYISMEENAEIWSQFESWAFPMELHVPCRDPIDHLMSQCNHRNIVFNCTSDPISQQIESCLIEMHRFSKRLANYSNINLKCYQYNFTTPLYLEYMGKRLQRKRIEAECTFRPTNKDRKKRDECVWNNVEVEHAARKYLLSNYDYYSFCNSCIGSDMELPLE